MPDHSGRITVGSLISIAQKAGWDATVWRELAGPPSRQYATVSPMQGAESASGSSAAPPLPPMPQRTQGRLLTAAEVKALPTTPYRIRSVFPARGFAAIFGASGSGKSFLALDLAYAIAAGLGEWFGFAVECGAVAYVALEGQDGVSKRIKALELHHKSDCPENLRFMLGGLQLLEGEGVDELSAEIDREVGPQATVIIDTLNQAAPNADENGSQDMGRIIKNAKKLAASIDGLVIVVHHSGKNRDRGLRGHSSLGAALDSVVEVRNPETGREWHLVKSKDDVADQTFEFELVPHTVGHDGYDVVTSCAVRRTTHQRQPAKKKPEGKHQIKAYEVIREALAGGSDSMTYRETVALVAPQLDITSGRKNERSKKAIEGLIQRGLLEMHEGAVCIS